MEGGIQMRRTSNVASIDAEQPPLDQADAHSNTSVNEGMRPKEANPPTGVLMEVTNAVATDSHLRSPSSDQRGSAPQVISCLKGVSSREDERTRQVRFEAKEERATPSYYAKEIALDRLVAFDKNVALPASSRQLLLSPAWWLENQDVSDTFWNIEMGETGAISARDRLQNMKSDVLPPPFGAGYVTAPYVLSLIHI